jgi:preprotein translocase subunit SecG
MYAIVLAILLIVALSLIGLVMLQKSEGGALGMGGGGMSGFMTGRSTANLLTRATAIAAALFFIACIALDWLAAHQRAERADVDLPMSAPTAPAPARPATAPTPTPAPQSNAPATPATPAAPVKSK